MALMGGFGWVMACWDILDRLVKLPGLFYCFVVAGFLGDILVPFNGVYGLFILYHIRTRAHCESSRGRGLDQLVLSRGVCLMIPGSLLSKYC